MERDPETNLVVPSAGQLAWQEDEIAAFYHMNPTFPVAGMTFAGFDPRVVVDAAESIGARHIVVVAKHVNGFCWWPTQAVKPGEAQNTLNIALTQYKNGTGNVVREIFDEARRRGIRPGVYLATRDDHFGAADRGIYNGTGGQQAYIDYYLTQATELATQYGELAEWWLDGSAIPALGTAINSLLNTHQPGAVVFQGTGATLRWIGNEGGIANHPTWYTINQTAWNSIQSGGDSVTTGDPDGVRWVPAEVDTHLSTGWFGGGPRSLADLTNVFYQSVGNGQGLLLNFPVQADGTIDPANLARGVDLGQAVDDAVGHPLFTAGPHDGATLTLDFGAPTEIDHVIAEEDLRFGERVRAFTIDGWNGSQWLPITSGSQIGRKQIRKFAPVTRSKVRLTVSSAVGTPKIRSLSVTRTGVEAPDTTPPTTPGGLAATVVEDHVDLSWQAASDPDTGIQQYRIYRNSVPVGTVSQTTWHDGGAPENQACTYEVSAVNGYGIEGGRSIPVEISTGMDRTAPTVLSATTQPGRSSVRVVFSEAVREAGAEAANHYHLTHGRSVTAAVWDPALPDRVLLTLDGPLAPEILYMLTVSDVTDDAIAPNPIGANSTQFRIRNFGLARHWRLDDASGTTALDAVAGVTAPGNNARLVGATWSAAGRSGGALAFDGNDHANAGVAGLQTNFTVALWVRPESAAASQVLFGKDRSGVGAYQQRLYLQNLRPGFMLSNENGADFGLWAFEHDAALPLNTWTHLAVTNAGDTFRLFVNGILVRSKQASGIIQSPYNPADLLLGARWNSSLTTAVDRFTGKLDDVRIYTEPLPQEELQQVLAEADGTPEPDTDGDEIPDPYELDQTGNLDSMNSSSDADHDGSLDKHEYIAGTDPLNPADRLRITDLTASGAPGLWNLTWTSKADRVYHVQIASNLASGAWTDSGLGAVPPAPGNTTSAQVPSTGPHGWFRVAVSRPD